tara:strand:- start:2296 stop:2637 length:342 start_codon:yes stop_codon:yes gene_type:complete
MFGEQNHLHAFCTAMGSLGGFQPQPVWFSTFAQNTLFQILVLSILIYQGGGGLNYPYSLTIAIIFYTLVNLSKYITFGGRPPKTVAEEAAETAAAEGSESTNEVTAEEYYYNY